MGFLKYSSLACLTAGALLSCMAPVSADNEVRVQKITWVKPETSLVQSQEKAPTGQAPSAPSSPAKDKLTPSPATVPADAAKGDGATIRVQKITWVKPEKATSAAPAAVSSSPAPTKTAVKTSPNKNSKASTTKASPPQAAAQATSEVTAVDPLFPSKVPLQSTLAHYYGIKESVVNKAFQVFGYSEDAMVALFLANAANTDLDRIIQLRQGNQWKDVINFLQLDTKYLFKNLQMGNVPRSSTRYSMGYIQFINWREDPEYRDLADLSVRALVVSSFIVNRFHAGPLEVFKDIYTAGSAMPVIERFTYWKE